MATANKPINGIKLNKYLDCFDAKSAQTAASVTQNPNSSVSDRADARLLESFAPFLRKGVYEQVRNYSENNLVDNQYVTSIDQLPNAIKQYENEQRQKYLTGLKAPYPDCPLTDLSGADKEPVPGRTHKLVQVFAMVFSLALVMIGVVLFYRGLSPSISDSESKKKSCTIGGGILLFVGIMSFFGILFFGPLFKG